MWSVQLPGRSEIISFYSSTLVPYPYIERKEPAEFSVRGTLAGSAMGTQTYITVLLPFRFFKAGSTALKVSGILIALLIGN